MIELYQFYPAFGMPSASSFCLKVETYLRMVALPYRVVVVDRPGKSPRGKLPYIRDGRNEVADSSIIIDYLKSSYGDPLDSGLNDGQRALALATQRMVEESLYWSVLYSRWAEPQGWATLMPEFFRVLPAPIRPLIASLVRRKIIRDIRGQGRGLLSADELYAHATAELHALSTLLGAKPYFLGDRPTTLDATIYGLLAQVFFAPIPSPLKTAAESHANLKDHTVRIREEYFSSPNSPSNSPPGTP